MSDCAPKKSNLIQAIEEKAPSSHQLSFGCSWSFSPTWLKGCSLCDPLFPFLSAMARCRKAAFPSMTLTCSSKKSLTRGARATSCQSLTGVFIAQLGLESNFQQFLLSVTRSQKRGGNGAGTLQSPGHVCGTRAPCRPLGRGKNLFGFAFVCVSAQAASQTSPSFSINLLRTKWASLSERIPPVKGLVGVPELIVGFSSAFPTWVFLGLWNPI